MTTVESVNGPFDFGRVIQRTFRVIGQNLGAFALWALILVAAPFFIVTLLALRSGANELTPLYSFGGVILSAIGSCVLQGVVVRTVIDRLHGRSVSVGAALGAGARFVLPLIGLAIVSFIAFMIGFVLIIVPALILMTIWSVAAPSLVIEERGVFESLQRSRDLTRGHRWSIFGLLVVYFILSMVIGSVFRVASAATGVTIAGGFSTGSVDNFTLTLVMTIFVSAVVNAAQGVIAAAGASSIYYELRATKEGVAPDQLAAVFD